MDPSTQGRFTAMWLTPGNNGPAVRLRCIGDVSLLAGPSVGVVSAVAIELPGRVYSRASASLILECAATAGALAGRVVSVFGGGVVRCIYPEDWREWLTGKRSAKNKEIREALVRMGFAHPRKGNNHEMDAIGVALYLAWSLDTGKGKSCSWLSPPSLRDYVPARKGTASSAQARSRRKPG